MNQVISTDEMCRRYLAAEDKEACVRSLARLCDCLPRQIEHFLEQEGAFAQAAHLAKRRAYGREYPPAAVPAPREAPGPRVVRAAAKISALDYARKTGHPLIRTAHGFISEKIPGLLFTDNGGWRLGREQGTATKFIMRFEKADRETAVKRLLDACAPKEAAYLATRFTEGGKDEHIRMLPADRLAGCEAPEPEYGERREPKKSRREGKDHERDD